MVGGVTTHLTQTVFWLEFGEKRGRFTAGTHHRMPANVRKTPAYLKGLAETRARVDGQIQ
jgi:hypothetical protein